MITFGENPLNIVAGLSLKLSYEAYINVRII